MENLNKFCYIILSPRCIPEVEFAFSCLHWTKFWVKGFIEFELAVEIDNIVDITNFDYYIICADDIIPTAKVVNGIQSLVDKNIIITGYSELCVGDIYLNLCETPLLESDWPEDKHYNYMTIDEVSHKNQDKFKTYYSGFSMTCIPREILKNNPINVLPISLKHSDYLFSQRMSKLGIDMFSQKDLYVQHLKEERNTRLTKNWYHGPKQVIIQR